MSLINKRKCLNCNLFFTPTPQNTHRQKYCSQAVCRKASKHSSQQTWLSKQENKDYFKGSHHVDRVRTWRKGAPGYWRRQRSITPTALQDRSPQETIDNKGIKPLITQEPLQDHSTAQSLILIGLIAKITATALQDDIVCQMDGLLQLGRDIIRNPLPQRFNRGEEVLQDN